MCHKLTPLANGSHQLRVPTSRMAAIHTLHRARLPERSTVRFANQAAINHTTMKMTQHTSMNRPASCDTSVSVAR